MRPRVLHRCVLWLLPLLIARLFVPAGFMVSATSAGLDVMLCPVYAALPELPAQSSVRAHHAGMNHSAHAMQGSSTDVPHQGAEQGASQSLCPFASAAGAPLIATVGAISHFYGLIGKTPSLLDEPARVSRAVLIDRIRGPPFA